MSFRRFLVVSIVAIVVSIIIAPAGLIIGLISLALSAGVSSGAATVCNSSPMATSSNVTISQAIAKANNIVIKGEPLQNILKAYGVMVSRGLSKRDSLIMVMIIIQESKGINYKVAKDHDSLGIFQQRPSQGWGTPAQVTNIEYATNTAIDHLLNVDNREQMSYLDVALKVQNPSRAAYLDPHNYFPGWEDEAQAIIDSATVVGSGSGLDGGGMNDAAQLAAVANPGCSTGIEAVVVAMSAVQSQVGKQLTADQGANDGTGLMAWAYQQAGVSLLPEPSDQLNKGVSVDFRQDLTPGDLLYFSSSEGSDAIHRVGMFVSDNQMFAVASDGTVKQVEPNWKKYVGASRPVPVPFSVVPLANYPANGSNILTGNSSGKWVAPLPGTFHVGSAYGMRFHPTKHHWSLHDGVDLSGGVDGREIHAAADGVVKSVVRSGIDYGWHVVIDHGDGITTLYGHMQAFANGLAEGQPVTAGQTIGYVGETGAATGPHLHFTVRISGKPTDPVPFMRNHGVAL